ncbi:MAG: hypothetical protein ABIP71_00025, partial [Verrucomicrobiota bacterium]
KGRSQPITLTLATSLHWLTCSSFWHRERSLVEQRSTHVFWIYWSDYFGNDLFYRDLSTNSVKAIPGTCEPTNHAQDTLACAAGFQSSTPG